MQHTVTFIRDSCTKFGIPNLPQPPDIGQNSNQVIDLVLIFCKKILILAKFRWSYCYKVHFLKLNICVYLHAKFQVFSIILINFRHSEGKFCSEKTFCLGNINIILLSFFSLSVCRSVCLSVCLSVWQSVCLSLKVVLKFFGNLQKYTCTRVSA